MKYLELIAASNDFLAAAKRAYTVMLQTGTGGNVSTRISGEDLMFVKPSGVSFGDCTQENLVITDYTGNVIEGGKPTRELYLHGALYDRYSAIGGIVHTHSVYSILVAQLVEEMELITKHSVLKIGIDIPVVPVVAPAVGEDEIEKVFDVLDENPELPAFILKDHGIVSFAATTKKAGEIAELIEETAKIYYLKLLRERR